MKQLIVTVFLLINFVNNAQSLKGKLKQHAGQQISLIGFNYYHTEELGRTTIDSLGNFKLSYPKDYRGMAFLNTEDNSGLVFVLSEKNINLEGSNLKEPTGLVFTNSVENTNFMQYAKMQEVYSSALSAWQFLDKLYKKEPLFNSSKKIKKSIQNELKQIAKEDVKFVNSLNKEGYLRWFVPYRKLIQDMPNLIKTAPQRIPKIIQGFRAIDFNNPNFKTSGLFKELIEGHYLLLENMGQPLDSVYKQMNKSTQYLIDNLQSKDSLLNKVSGKLFNFFEKRSLFKASEYLSVSLLNNNQCSLDANLTAKLESYRKMKVGKIAPDIILKEHKKLSDITTNKFVIFGASWCPNCKKETAELQNKLSLLKDKNIKVVFISIDTDAAAYKKAYKNVPWQMYCDFKGWETKAVKDYYVSGTPTSFLLDSNNKILLRPNSVAHLLAWINLNL